MSGLRYPEPEGFTLVDGPRALNIEIFDEEETDEPRAIDVNVFNDYRTHDELFLFFALDADQARAVAAELLRLADELEATDGPAGAGTAE